MTHQRQVTLDTSVGTHHGWIVDAGSATGEIIFAIADFVEIPDSGEPGDIGGYMWGTPTALETYLVHPAAGFILLTPAGNDPKTVIDYAAFTEAVTQSDDGECPNSEDCFWLASAGVTGSVDGQHLHPRRPGRQPFVAYIDTNGELVQLEQQRGLP